MILNFSLENKKNWLNALLAFLAVFIWTVFLYRSTFIGMVNIWTRSETFTHGFLVFPITLWLIFRKRKIIALIQPEINLIALIPIGFICVIWLLANLVSINSVTQLAATAIIVLLVRAIFGKNVVSVIIFPLLFLFFAVPLGEFLLPLLMEWTAKFTVIAVRLSGVPVYQEGLQFVISSGNWSVVEACSGVRYLISSIMIGTLYAYLNYQSLKRRLIFIGFSVLVPVVANWMRAYLIVMLGHISGNKLAVGFDHLIYGWLFFGVVIMVMFLVGGRWAENFNSNENILKNKLINNLSNTANFWYSALVISIFLAIPISWVNFIAYKNNTATTPLIVQDTFISSWEKLNDESIILKPTFEDNDNYSNKIYKKNTSNVGLYIRYFSNQNYENKLVSSTNIIFDNKDKNWIKLDAKNIFLDRVSNGFTIRAVHWRRIRNFNQAGEVDLYTWQFYWVNNLFTANDYKAKIYGALQQLLGNGDDSAIVVLYANETNADLANKLLEKYLSDNYFEIKKFLEKSRDR